MEIGKIAGMLLKSRLIGVETRDNNGDKIVKAKREAKKDEVILSKKSEKLYQYQSVKKTFNLPASQIKSNKIMSNNIKGEKIESLKKQIPEGSYYIPAGKIAEKIWQAYKV